MEDVGAKVRSMSCTFKFNTPLARQKAVKEFSTSRERTVDIWHAANHVHDFEASGLTVTPGTLTAIDRARRKLLDVEYAADPDAEGAGGRGLRNTIDRAIDEAADARADVRLLKVFGTVLISLLLAARAWDIGEPLLTEIRRWWRA